MVKYPAHASAIVSGMRWRIGCGLLLIKHGV
jgi:hypothetical protein